MEAARTKSDNDLALKGPVIEIVNRKTNVSFDVDPAETNEAKKLKLDMQRSIQPTQVVHVRNAPEDISALDLCILAMKFGTVINTLIMRQKGQAFIEFAEESQAIAFVNYHNYVPAIVRNKHVFIQLSTHSHLKTNAESQSATQAALNALASYPGAQTPNAMPPAIPQIVSSSALSTAQMLPLQEGCILHLIIERAIYSVTLDTLYQIFSRFGPVAKIVTFNKNSEFQGFVQYVDQLSAMAALNSLNNQNVYSGCCTLRLSETKMKDLDVKSNSDKARDYTKEPPQFMRSTPRLGMDNIPIFSPMQTPGAMQGLQGLQGLQYTQMIQPQLTAYPSLAAASNPVQTIATTPSTITTPTLSPLNYDKMILPNNFKFITAAQLPPHPQLGYSISSVLLVSNLAECIASPDALFILFGVYGDVRRVKILYKKPDTALVQMQDPISAQQALLSLNGVVCGDKKIYVSYSIYMEVQMPKPTDEAQDLTKDFSDSPLHRFRKPNQKVRENVYGPSPCLHLSNIPAEVTEEELKKMFESCGTIVNFRFLTSERPDKQMALLEFTNTSSAICGLVQFHNKEFITEAGRQYLRISFSKAGCIQK
ncbi:polypyrimidine tract-binding protein 2-like isoform X2 [Bolinopsis microptera]|uniref:polypyrimidine tract-binding protein 2-like isoform X2 n=1 Tax=Bolinopsis microptera TaxID=2820187 RepID=UPI003078E762